MKGGIKSHFCGGIGEVEPETSHQSGVRQSILKPNELARTKKLAAINEPKGEHLEDIVRQMSLASTSEIDRLIRDLEDLRGKLVKDGNRIETEIVEYASLSRSAAQLEIVSDSLAQVGKGSGAPRNNVAKQAARLAPEDANICGAHLAVNIMGIGNLE